MALIDREKLKKALPHKTPYDRYGNGFNDCLERVKDIIDEQPVIEVHQAGNECDTCEHETDDSGYCLECYYGGKWQMKNADTEKITCLNCKYLEITFPYGECSLQPRIVNPDDTCEYAEPKEKGGEG